MFNNFYIKKNAEGPIFGPFSKIEIDDYIKIGKLLYSDYISIDKKKWHSIKSFQNTTQEHFPEQNSIIQKFENYKLIEEIGRGGMGVVYKALDLKLNRICALKILISNNEDISIKRFIDEAKSIAKLSHPNIITVYEIGTLPDYFFTMEYVNGGNLKQILNKLKIKDKLEIFYKICLGINFAHKNGIIHRRYKAK